MSLALIAPSVLQGVATATERIVLADGSGAFTTIQAAVSASANGDTVSLGDGVFRGEGNWSISVSGMDVVIRSSSGDPLRCVLEFDAATAHHGSGFIFATGTSSATQLTGITVRGGRFGGVGVGVRAFGSSGPTIEHCIFEDNRAAGYGGAVSAAGTGVVLRSCVFTDNDAYEYGGAVVAFGASMEIQDCSFYGNTTYGGAGAVWIYPGSSAALTDCIFIGNSCGREGGALVVEAAARLERCLLVQNSAGGWGGGIAAHQAHVELISCTLADNVAEEGGGIAIYYPGNPSEIVLAQSILWGNHAATGREAWFDASSATSSLSLNCSLTDASEIAGPGQLLFQNGSVDGDPLFCGSGVYTLDRMSPALRAQCGVMGALGAGCGVVSVRPSSWAHIKAGYRP